MRPLSSESMTVLKSPTGFILHTRPTGSCWLVLVAHHDGHSTALLIRYTMMYMMMRVVGPRYPTTTTPGPKTLLWLKKRDHQHQRQRQRASSKACLPLQPYGLECEAALVTALIIGSCPQTLG